MSNKFGHATREEIEQHDAAVATRNAQGIPLGGHRRFSTCAIPDWQYPLVCVCDDPVPEWVYVAHQCATCKRLIKDTT